MKHLPEAGYAADIRGGKYTVLRAAVLCAAASLLLAGCARTGRPKETDAAVPETVYYGPQGNYDESVAVSGVNENTSPYFGIMHVSVLDVNGTPGDSTAVYSFRDKRDSENAWSVTGLEIGYMEAEIVPEAEVAILFHGDIIRDAEGLEFIAVLPEADYVIKKASGTTLSNTMGGFSIRTEDGGTLNFVKDNCRIEENAMDRDSGDIITVYYADGGELGNFPLRVYGVRS